MGNPDKKGLKDKLLMGDKSNVTPLQAIFLLLCVFSFFAIAILAIWVATLKAPWGPFCSFLIINLLFGAFLVVFKSNLDWKLKTGNEVRLFQVTPGYIGLHTFLALAFSFTDTYLLRFDTPLFEGLFALILLGWMKFNSILREKIDEKRGIRPAPLKPVSQHPAAAYPKGAEWIARLGPQGSPEQMGNIVFISLLFTLPLIALAILTAECEIYLDRKGLTGTPTGDWIQYGIWFLVSACGLWATFWIGEKTRKWWTYHLKFTTAAFFTLFWEAVFIGVLRLYPAFQEGVGKLIPGGDSPGMAVLDLVVIFATALMVAFLVYGAWKEYWSFLRTRNWV